MDLTPLCHMSLGVLCVHPAAHVTAGLPRVSQYRRQTERALNKFADKEKRQILQKLRKLVACTLQDELGSSRGA